MFSNKVLIHYNPELPIILTTDASNNAVPAIFTHKIGDDLKFIYFIYITLTKSKKNYRNFVENLNNID